MTPKTMRCTARVLRGRLAPCSTAAQRLALHFVFETTRGVLASLFIVSGTIVIPVPKSVQRCEIGESARAQRVAWRAVACSLRQRL
jgi:hypothetical protein